MSRFFLALFLFFAAIFVSIIVIVALVGSEPGLSKGSVLHVTLSGTPPEAPRAKALDILAEKSTPSILELTRSIRMAGDDERILGLLVEVSNLRVGAARASELFEAISAFNESGKWSIAYMETAGEMSQGTGAYAVASAANEVFLSPPGDINLVGLGSQVPFARGLFDKLGIEPHFERRHEYKNAVDTFVADGLSIPHRESLTSILTDLQESMATLIARGRDKEQSEVQQWIQEGPYDSTQAEKIGLVDKLVYWDEVLDVVTQKTGSTPELVGPNTLIANASFQTGGKTFAYIIGEGQIHRGPSESAAFSDPTIGSDTFRKALREAREDGVDGILIRLDSPGGSYIASDLIRRELLVTRKANIPIVVSMGDVAASGGYFIAMGADKVVAEPGTITGSIGVFAGKFATRKLFSEHLGIKFEGVETSSNASLFGMLDPPSEEHKKIFAHFLDRIYDDFVGKAAQARGQKKEELEKNARGRVWSGKEALARGLVDKAGGIQVALDELRLLTNLSPDENVTLDLYPRPEGMLWALRQLFSGGMRTQSRAQLLKLIESEIQTLANPGVLSTPWPASTFIF